MAAVPLSTLVMTYEQPTSCARQDRSATSAGVVGVGMVEADDISWRSRARFWRSNQLLRSNVIAVLRGVRARVAATYRFMHAARVVEQLAEEHTAAFVRISFLTVTPDRVI